PRYCGPRELPLRLPCIMSPPAYFPNSPSNTRKPLESQTNAGSDISMMLFIRKLNRDPLEKSPCCSNKWSLRTATN
ncbi:Uncharacterized protein HZ326_16462, partial [Fusarium oxysporum f. sp. albedinis]